MKLHSLFISFGVFVLSLSAASATIYDVNDVAGLTTITGSITTDGTLGVLGVPNIVGYNLSINYGAETAAINTGNSTLTMGDGDLSATTSQLLFDFGDPALGFVQISSVTNYAVVWASAGNLLGQSISSYGLAPPYPSDVIDGISNPNGNFSFQAPSILPIAQVAGVPEPSTWAMMLLGFAGLGLARYDRGKDRSLLTVA